MESQNKDLQVTIKKELAKVRIQRVNGSVMVTVDAPSIAKIIHARTMKYLARDGYAQDRVFVKIPDTHDEYIMRAVGSDYMENVFRSNLGQLFYSSEPNLAILRHKNAVDGPVSFTVDAMLPTEELRSFKEKVSTFFRDFYTDYMVFFDTTLTVKVEENANGV